MYTYHSRDSYRNLLVVGQEGIVLIVCWNSVDRMGVEEGPKSDYVTIVWLAHVTITQNITYIVSRNRESSAMQ